MSHFFSSGRLGTGVDSVAVSGSVRGSRSALRVVALVAAAALSLGACASGTKNNSQASNEPISGEKGSVNLVTYDSFALSEETLALFTKESGYQVKVIKSGDGVELANKLILTKGSPVADVVFGLDNNVSGQVNDADVIEAFTGKMPETGVDLKMLDSKNLVAVDYGQVCLNYDKSYFQDKSLNPPTSLDDLVKPDYRNLTVVEDPRTSTPGLAFFLSTIQAKGQDAWQPYWEQLKANGVKVASSWDDAFNADFTAGGNEGGAGAYPVMVSYASSPAWAVSKDGQSSTIGNVPETCYPQYEYAGVLKGAANPEGAQALVEFLLGNAAQRDLTENNYMYPIRKGVELPEPLAKFGAPIENKMQGLHPNEVATNRETWVRTWAELMG